MRALLILLALLGLPAHALNFSLHMSQPQDKVQNQAGSEAADPLSPGIAFGHAFEVMDGMHFAPQLGYIRNEVKSDDHYSGKYKIETLYLHYDFYHQWRQLESLRTHFGFATMAKRIKGEGGTVVIPNGTGTAMAYRPGGTKTSYTHAFTTGLDWNFLETNGAVKKYGVFGQLFIYEILDGERRMFTALLGLNLEF